MEDEIDSSNVVLYMLVAKIFGFEIFRLESGKFGVQKILYPVAEYLGRKFALYIWRSPWNIVIICVAG